MAVDTPARIAILGAGPIGVETALYARFLGYDVDLYERQEVAANLLRWGHVRMFSPFSWNSSPLGLAALAAQAKGEEERNGVEQASAAPAGGEAADAEMLRSLRQGPLAAPTLA